MKQKKLANLRNQFLLPIVSIILTVATSVCAQDTSDSEAKSKSALRITTREVTFQILDTKGNPVAGVPIMKSVSYYQWNPGLFIPSHFFLQFKPHLKTYVGSLDRIGKTDEQGLLVVSASQLEFEKVASKIDFRYLAHSAWVRENSENPADAAFVVPGPSCSISIDELANEELSETPAIVQCVVETDHTKQ